MAKKSTTKAKQAKKKTPAKKGTPAKKKGAGNKKAAVDALSLVQKATIVHVLSPGQAAVNLSNPSIQIFGKPKITIINKVGSVDFQISFTIIPDDSNATMTSKPIPVGKNYAVFLKGNQSFETDVNDFKSLFGFNTTTGKVQLTANKIDIPADKGNHGQ